MSRKPWKRTWSGYLEVVEDDQEAMEDDQEAVEDDQEAIEN